MWLCRTGIGIKQPVLLLRTMFAFGAKPMFGKQMASCSHAAESRGPLASAI